MQILMDYKELIYELEQSVFGGINIWPTHPLKITHSLVILTFLHCRWLRVLTANEPNLYNLTNNLMEDFATYYRSDLATSAHPLDTRANNFKIALLVLGYVCPQCGHPGECSLFCRRCKHGLGHSTTPKPISQIGAKRDINPAYTKAMEEYNVWKSGLASTVTAKSVRDFQLHKNWKQFPYKLLLPDSTAAPTIATTPLSICPFTLYCLDQSKIQDIYVAKSSRRR